MLFFLRVAVCLGLIGLLAVSTSAGDIVVEKDIEYRKVGNETLKLNYARPEGGEGPFPCIVWIHGGGWVGGNRESFQVACEQSAKMGFASATISYRLTDVTATKPATKNPHPAQIHDCKAAIRFLRKNAEKYRIDPNRIGVIGASAGGHLSLLVGATDDKDGLEEEGADKSISTRVQAVVNYFGPTEMVSQYQGAQQIKYLMEGLCGGTPDSVPEQYKSVSPVTFITKDDPPILTFHGTTDNIVPVQQAKILDETCKKAGVSHEMHLYEGQGHGFDGKKTMEAAMRSFEFFKEHLMAEPGAK